MMKHSNYSVVDLLLNDSFVEWVKSGCREEDPWASWPDRHPEREEEFFQARDIILTASIIPSKELSTDEIRHISERINQEVSERERRNLPHGKVMLLVRSMAVRVAAAVLLCLTAGVSLLYLYRSEERPSEVAGRVWNGSQTINQPGLVRLPDGTSVVLKKGSSIHFVIPFANNKREVYLTGEAYFEVQKDKHRPFLVYSDQMVVKVLGTSFLVKAYKNDQQFKVTVTTGRVSVFSQKDASKARKSSSLDDLNGKGVLLAPCQQVTFNRDPETLTKREVETPSILSEDIAKSRLNFVETPFSEVVNTLSAAYDIPIVYNDDRLGKCPLTASLSDQTFYEKLALLCKAVEATYEVRDGRIVISGKGCRENEPN
ncbi:FecR family protein [Arcticibacter sp. MXS-1]|uniref:FecR family protein n=1 Tax=Arcticibacter sp. MXS-1 TaxID=3341726 RepID=UPI0035A99EB9